MDGAANDTALHVAAHSYDHESLLELLLLRGGAPGSSNSGSDPEGSGSEALDSSGRSALHLAADCTDQLLGLVKKASSLP